MSRIGKAGLIHHLADEQEERDGEERKVVQAHPHPLGNDRERHVPLYPDHQRGRDEHGERDRDAQQAQPEKQREQKDEHGLVRGLRRTRRRSAPLAERRPVHQEIRGGINRRQRGEGWNRGVDQRHVHARVAGRAEEADLRVADRLRRAAAPRTRAHRRQARCRAGNGASGLPTSVRRSRRSRNDGGPSRSSPRRAGRPRRRGTGRLPPTRSPARGSTKRVKT